MLDHLAMQCSDVEASGAFYDAVLAPIGARRIREFGKAIGYGTSPKPEFWIGQLATREGFRELHLAFTAPDREAVQQFFQAAVEFGAEIVDEPKESLHYHPNYYCASVRDPDGNNIEVVCHTAEGERPSAPSEAAT